MHGDDTAYGGTGGEQVTVSGVIQFFWDSGDDEKHLLINIDPDDHHKPDAWEITGELRDAVIADVDEGVFVEIDYLIEHHEIVDPDGATLDGNRPKILAVRISAG